MNRWQTLALAVTVLLAVLLRWPAIGQRPMHNDEAVNGLKFGQLWEQGKYRYDPNEHHGPTLYYAAVAVLRLAGASSKITEISASQLRRVTAVFGLGLILLLPLFWDALGRWGIAWAALLIALSPGFVFYSDYFIHEILLVFFATALMGCAWRYWRTRRMGWILLAGASLGLMAATKETFVLSIAAALIAIGLNQGWNRLLDASELPVRAAKLNWVHLLLFCGVSLATACIFFTSFFTNAAGPLDAIRTYQPWLARAGGDSPHIHPWYFYWNRLLFWTPPKGPIWTEALILVLACVGAASGFIRAGAGDSRPSFLRFLTFYSVTLSGIYSIIGYKTPWCLLNFWLGFILLAGAGAAWLLRRYRSSLQRAVILLLLAAGSIHLGLQAQRAMTEYSASPKNPYVYAQTLHNLITRLTERVNELAALADGPDTLIKVIAKDDDYWPLPWYFRGYRQVGWWDHLPEDPYAPIMVVSANLHAALDDKHTHLMVGYAEMRPGVFLELYVEFELWKKFLDRRKGQ